MFLQVVEEDGQTKLTLDDAVKTAIKRVNKGNELQNYKSKDIDDCFWLGDDTGVPD